MRNLLILVLCALAIPAVAKKRSPSWQYHFLPGKTYLYHYHLRTTASTMTNRGLRPTNITRDADVSVHVEGVTESGNARLSVNWGNFKDDDIHGGGPTVFRVILIPQSVVLVSNTGKMITGMLMQEDSARREAKKVASEITYTDVHPVGDQTALSRSLRSVLPGLPAQDSFYNGQQWVDTIVEGSHNYVAEVDKHIYGKEEPVVGSENIKLDSRTLSEYKVATDKPYADRVAWELDVNERSVGKQDGLDYTTSIDDQYHFAADNNMILGYKSERTKDMASFHFKSVVTLTLTSVQ